MAPVNSHPLWTKNFILVLIISCLNFFSLSIVNNTLSTYVVTEYQGTPSQVGSVTSLMILCAFFFRPLAGHIVDKWGRKWTLMVSLLLTGIGNLLLLSDMSLTQLSISRFFMGIPFSINTIGISSLSADIIPEVQLSEGLGINSVATTLIALVIAPNLGFFIAARHGFHSIFILSALIALAAIFLISTLKTKDIKDPEVKFSIKSFFEIRVVWIAFVLCVLFFGWPGLSAYSPLYADELGLSSRGIFLICYGMGSFAATFLNNKLSRNNWPQKSAFLSLLLILGGFSLIGSVRMVFAFISGGLILGLGYGIAFATFPAMAMNLVRPEERGKSNATTLIGQDIGAVLGSLGIGFVAEITKSYQYSYLLLAGLTFIPLLFLTIRVIPHYEKQLDKIN